MAKNEQNKDLQKAKDVKGTMKKLIKKDVKHVYRI